MREEQCGYHKNDNPQILSCEHRHRRNQWTPAELSRGLSQTALPRQRGETEGILN